MKATKRILALVLALAMVFALTATAFAEYTYTKLTEADTYDANATYYTSDGSSYTEDSSVTADNFADRVAGGLYTRSGSAKNDSITVNNTKVGETYNLYKLFDLVVNDENAPSAYSYRVNADWADFFKAAGADPTADPAGPGYAFITVSDTGYVTAISDAAALAKAAASWSSKPAAKQSIEAIATTVKFNSLENGYWLITSTLGSIAMTETTPDDSAVTVNEKNPEDTIKKEVKEDSTGKFGEENDAQIGDTIEFKSTVKIVKGTRNVVVHDKMTEGLTYTAGSVAITGLTEGTEYTVNESPTDDDTFDISFTQSWIDSLDFGTDGYKEYEITYTATLNEKAVKTESGTTSLVDQENTTKVSFGDKTNSESDKTTTTTHKFSVYKHAKGSTENLAGAVFSLKKGSSTDSVVVALIKIDDNNYRVAKTGETETTTDTFTTVANGDIVIWGVDSDSDYTLEEITAPNGYNKLKDPVSVTVNADNSTRTDVENNTGTELPSTGGIGTTIFYIVGGILVLGAGVVLIARRRMNADA